MTPFTLALSDATDRALTGGKAAGLARLSGIDGVAVPDGFCVTTTAYRQVVAPAIDDRLDALHAVDPDDLAAIHHHAADIRHRIEGVGVPAGLAADVHDRLSRHDAGAGWAVRSSATAEDLPAASFAGQQDSFLNIRADDVVTHVRRCWASLFTDRAVTYRARAGIDHRTAAMAVVVQRMVDPQVSGVMFTADPVTGARSVVAVEATPGLGERLVAGAAPADAWRVRGTTIVDRTVATKPFALRLSASGGTEQCPVPDDRQRLAALTDDQVVELARWGRAIEARAGSPQDVEWCLDDVGFQFVQSRPITTLFPVPPVDDDRLHVYLSVGHPQMMTDAMRPLGLSLWRLTSRAPMREAGSRLFVDVTDALASPAMRPGLLDNASRSDPLTGDALRTLVARGDLLPEPAQGGGGAPAPATTPGDGLLPLDDDPDLPAALVDAWESANATAAATLSTLDGVQALDAVRTDIDHLREVLFDPRSHQAIMAGVEATWWLHDRLSEWLGDTTMVDSLALAAPGNVSADMGLALLDVADSIRPFPDVVAALQAVDPDTGGDPFADVAGVDGGPVAVAAIRGFLAVHGVRCVGEIDVTRPRWHERPAAIVPVLLANVRNARDGAARRQVERGRRDALAAKHEVLRRLRAGPDGGARAARTAQMVDRMRRFIGYREYPKYGLVTRWFTYRQVMLRVAGQLVRDGVLADVDDISWLTVDELREVAASGTVDQALLFRRREAFRSARSLAPPRVMTSDGEVIVGTYGRDDLPDGALAGLAVSSGIVDGRARVIHDIADADPEPGDILVTVGTDPSWSPVFVAVAGLVTEVGGSMTHGAVVAREYGLPAVVGVQDATRLIPDGATIRVHGTAGYVQVLSAGEPGR